MQNKRTYRKLLFTTPGYKNGFSYCPTTIIYTRSPGLAEFHHSPISHGIEIFNLKANQRLINYFSGQSEEKAKEKSFYG
ncbi:hypothetical protein BpHYR1_051935 [Brachionus plicatilis]|uniref:Uncharacterized protein n=1 Tax=Brachionus plicatilis TaxID=10195 RepID=A0A3M7SHN5_BRAPC|nr:hypothetical protein BpHYR1_051935 [Brachionus plicatilis]